MTDDSEIRRAVIQSIRTPRAGQTRLGAIPNNINPETGKTNFRARRLSRNWIPDNLINGIHLLSMSIGNVVCALRIMNGEEPGKCLFHNPDRPEAFDAPWALSCGVNELNMDLILTKGHVEPLSKQEILDFYDQTKDKSAE